MKKQSGKVLACTSALMLSVSLIAQKPKLYDSEKEIIKPNLIIIHTDEHNFRTLGCYRETLSDDQAFVWGKEAIVETPHIDRLAQEGVLCANWYATSPVCALSRASMVTGLYPIATGSPMNHMPLNDDVITFAEILKNNGYATSYVGKWHLDGEDRPGFAPERKFGFDDNRYMINRGHWKTASARVPFLLRYPGKIKPGKQIEKAYTMADFAPTILGLMGVDHSAYSFHGIDASSDFKSKTITVEDGRIVYMTNAYSNWVAAVNNQYKLVLSPRDKPWLFDLKRDPDERINFYNDPEYQDIASKFKEELFRQMELYQEPLKREDIQL